MKISIKAMKKLSKISNSLYDAIKIEYLYHSNKLEGSTFSKENLIDLLEQRQVVGEHFIDDVIETKNSLELFDKVIDTLGEPFDKYLLWDWHRTLKKRSIDDEYNKEYRLALYQAQTFDNIEPLVEVFKKCQTRTDEKLNDFKSLLGQINSEME